MIKLDLKIGRVTLLRNKYGMDKLYFHLCDRDTVRINKACGGTLGGGSLQMDVPAGRGERVLKMLNIPEGIIEFVAMSDS